MSQKNRIFIYLYNRLIKVETYSRDDKQRERKRWGDSQKIRQEDHLVFKSLCKTLL